MNPDDRRDSVITGIRETLAWHQLPAGIKSRWEAIATRVAASYEAADTHQRRRWARSGIRLSANVVLEAVAERAAAAIDQLEPGTRDDPVALIAAILGEGRLAQLLSLVEHRDYRFKRRRHGPIEEIEVDLLALVLDWVRGIPLKDLTDSHLDEVYGGDDGAFPVRTAQHIPGSHLRAPPPIYHRNNPRMDKRRPHQRSEPVTSRPPPLRRPRP